MRTARRVQPEWLDELPADDPRARRSRRDLARINALMGNAALVADELQAGLSPIAEIGAGDGGFLLRVARAMGTRDVEAILVDRKDVVTPAMRGQFAAHGWRAKAIEADVFDWLRETAAVDAIVANLFLHHFEPPRLAEMLALAAVRARVFVACEPRRSAFALNGARLLGLAGCNDVSRHDAVVSVRAGFRDGELASLWPKDAAWELREGARGLFSHVFVARRRA